MKFKTLLMCSCLMASIVNATEVPANYNIQGSLGGLGRAINSHILAEMRNGEDVQQFLTASRAISETKQDSLYFWAIGENRQNYFSDQFVETYEKACETWTNSQSKLSEEQLQYVFYFIINPKMWINGNIQNIEFWKDNIWKGFIESVIKSENLNEFSEGYKNGEEWRGYISADSLDPERTGQALHCCYVTAVFNALLNQVRATLTGAALGPDERLTIANIRDLITESQKEGSQFRKITPEKQNQRLISIEQQVQELHNLFTGLLDHYGTVQEEEQEEIEQLQMEDRRQIEDRLTEILQNVENLAFRILTKASKYGFLFLVEDLVNRGADVNRTDRYGESPLHKASSEGHLSIVEYLVNHEADVNETDIWGQTPFYIASSNGHLSIVEYLVNHVAAVNQGNISGCTPLHWASSNGHQSIVEYLISHGADVNETDIWGETPLYIASSNGHLSIVEYLVNHEADVNKTDIWGQTPLYIASYNGHQSIVEYLASQVEENEGELLSQPSFWQRTKTVFSNIFGWTWKWWRK